LGGGDFRFERGAPDEPMIELDVLFPAELHRTAIKLAGAPGHDGHFAIEVDLIAHLRLRSRRQWSRAGAFSF
jgi:hypothetical protein